MGFRMARKRRDVYKGRFDEGFDIEKDVDLVHLKKLMMMPEVEGKEYNWYGVYIQNIIKISLHDDHFRGYPDDVIEDMTTEALIDCVKARKHFNAEKYPTATAPFNYLMTVAKHSFIHVLDKYYKTKQNLIFAASRIEENTKTMDGDDFDSSLIDKAATDWNEIHENLL